jgi:hypothetical protein
MRKSGGGSPLVAFDRLTSSVELQPSGCGSDSACNSRTKQNFLRVHCQRYCSFLIFVGFIGNFDQVSNLDYGLLQLHIELTIFNARIYKWKQY